VSFQPAWLCVVTEMLEQPKAWCLALLLVHRDATAHELWMLWIMEGVAAHEQR
jgi:hypothetical protein